MRKMLERIGARLGYKYIRYGAFWRRFFRAHKPEIERLKALLADEKSVEVVESFLKTRKTHNLKYILEHAESSRQRYTLSNGEAVEYEDVQYFPKGVIQLSDNEVFIDGGGYFGDTTLAFISHTGGKFRKVHVFEALTETFEQLQHNIKLTEFEHQIRLHNVGLYSEEKEVYFSQAGAGSRPDENGTSLVRLVAMDAYLTEQERAEITYIKLDIEGSEMEALKGMRETIIKYKPKLAICIYHEADDLWKIPLYIHQLNPGYRLYVRHHDSKYLLETVCYAIP